MFLSFNNDKCPYIKDYYAFPVVYYSVFYYEVLNTFLTDFNIEFPDLEFTVGGLILVEVNNDYAISPLVKSSSLKGF